MKVLAVAVLGALASAFAQDRAPLTAAEAIEIVENSPPFLQLMRDQLCPSASADGLGPDGKIWVRLRSQCPAGVSTLVGDFAVNSQTGTLTDVSDAVILGPDAPPVVSVLANASAALLSQAEAGCLAANASERPQDQRRIRRIEWEGEPAFSITLYGAAGDANPPIDLVVTRRTWRTFDERLRRENLSSDVTRLRQLLRSFKEPARLSADAVLTGLRRSPALSRWSGAAPCRRVQINTREEGATFFSVDVVSRCADDGDTGEGGAFVVSKITGATSCYAGTCPVEPVLPEVTSLLSALMTKRDNARAEFDRACRRAEQP